MIIPVGTKVGATRPDDALTYVAMIDRDDLQFDLLRLLRFIEMIYIFYVYDDRSRLWP
jgi:hypothetical protein